MRTYSKDAGFSLIEVLVVIAIMSVVTTVMASMMERQVHDQKHVLQRAELNDLKTVLGLILSDRDRCVAEFNGVSFDAVSGSDVVPTSSTPIGQILYDPGTPTSVAVRSQSALPGSQSGLAVTTIRLAKILRAYSGAQKPRFSAVLEVSVDGRSTAGSFHPVEVPLTINTDVASGSSTITSCAGTIATPQTACLAIIGATWDQASESCTLPSKQCEGVTVPNPSGQCDGGNADTSVCPYGGHGGVYACTAAGWQCVNSECKTQPTTITNTTVIQQTGGGGGGNNTPVCANQAVPPGFCENGCGGTGQIYCSPGGWGCLQSGCPSGPGSDDGDDDDGG